MSVKTRSARGEVVDFDLLKVKEQIASAPAPTDVKARQSFVDRRLRRRVKKVQPKAEVERKAPVSPKMPQPENLNVEEKLIDNISNKTDQAAVPVENKKMPEPAPKPAPLPTKGAQPAQKAKPKIND